MRVSALVCVCSQCLWVQLCGFVCLRVFEFVCVRVCVRMRVSRPPLLVLGSPGSAPGPASPPDTHPPVTAITVITAFVVVII